MGRLLTDGENQQRNPARSTAEAMTENEDASDYEDRNIQNDLRDGDDAVFI